MSAITVTKAPRGNSYYVSVDGKPPERVNPLDAATVRRAAKAAGVPFDALWSAVEAAARAPAPDATPPEPPFPVIAYGLPDAEPVTLEGAGPVAALEAAFATPFPYARWCERDKLCALDVDLVKGAPGWTDEDVRDNVPRTIGPLPALAWRSRSGGAHLVFVADAEGTGYGLTAEQRAAVYALTSPWLADAKVRQVELLAHTRVPPFGVAWRATERYAVPNLKARLALDEGEGSVTQAEVETVLAELGLVIGERYPHTRCPIDPRPTSSDASLQVRVLDDGIHCFVCAGLTGKGFMPWARLLRRSQQDGPEEEPDPVVAAAVARVHFAHANLLLQALHARMTAAGRRAGYAGLLKIMHPADGEDVLAPSLELVRGPGQWLWSDTLSPADLSDATFRTVPWTRGIPSRVDCARRDPCLHGFEPVLPTRMLADRPSWIDGRLYAPVPTPTDAPFVGEPDATWSDLRARFPGMEAEHEVALRVLALAAARAQRGSGPPPIVLLLGGTNSGKTYLTNLVRGAIGGPTATIDVHDETETERSMGDGFASGAALLFGDEAGKSRGTWGISAPILRASSVFSYRALYHGHRTVAATAALVLAGSTPPTGCSTMAELVRRGVLVRLPSVRDVDAASWPAALRGWLGTENPLEVRRTPAGRRWAEGLIRWARDRALGEDGAWRDVGMALGARSIAEAEEASGDLRHAIRELYGCWTGPSDKPFMAAGRRSGWLRCHREGPEGDPAEAAAAALEHWLEPGLSEAARWARLGELRTARAATELGFPDRRITLDLAGSGARLYARFRNEDHPTAGRLDPAAFPKVTT